MFAQCPCSAPTRGAPAAQPVPLAPPMDYLAAVDIVRQGADSALLGRLDAVVAAVREPDRNWFYSSLAQSAAAIVGLMGGLLAGQLQSELEKVRSKRYGFRTWVGTYRNEAVGRAADCSRIALEADVARAKDAADLVPLLGAAGKARRLSEVRSQVAAFKQLALSTAVVDFAVRQAEVGARERDPNSDRAQLERSGSFKWPALGILVVLSVLCFFGVIWPLARLDAMEDGSQARMMLGLGLGLLGLLALLGWQLTRLWRAASVSDLERAYTEHPE